MRTTFKNILLTVTAIMALALPLTSRGAVANVTVNNLPTGFTPSSTTINPGDSVIWTWPVGSVAHNVSSTSSPQEWTTSAILNGPATFTNVFSTTTHGTFPYVCTVHGFTGQIIVVTNVVLNPPTVSITNPPSSSVFATPANVTVRAAASDPNSGGSITNVEFRVDNNILADVRTAPYSATTNGMGTGTHTLAAVAADNSGLKATNSISISVVTPAPLVIGSVVRLSASHFQLSYAATAGLTYIVQKSPDLRANNWTSISTNTAASGNVFFMDTNAISSPAFYRVQLAPNP
jgi:plastocyanin